MVTPDVFGVGTKSRDKVIYIDHGRSEDKGRDKDRRGAGGV